jgi:hypothetical protein
MHWQKARGGPLSRFSQSLLLRVPAELVERELAAALAALVGHHEALRLTLDAEADGTWRLHIPEPAPAPERSVAGASLLRRVAVDGLAGPALQERLAAEAEACERRLDPAAGLMLQAVWFDAGASQPGHLLLAIHHLAVDGVSWRILAEDVEAAWRAVRAGRPVSLAPRGTSFRRWAGHLAAQAGSAAVAAELPYWRSQGEGPALRLSPGGLDPLRDTLGSAGQLTLRLEAQATQALLTRVAAAFHGGIEDVLLTGLSLAVADWCGRRGVRACGADRPGGAWSGGRIWS